MRAILEISQGELPPEVKKYCYDIAPHGSDMTVSLDLSEQDDIMLQWIKKKTEGRIDLDQFCHCGYLCTYVSSD